MNTLANFAKDESGTTAVAYGLIVAGISVAIVAVLNALTTQLIETFSSISTSLAAASGHK